MANMLFANNCNTTLNGGITAVATSMVVTSATGFPSPTGSQYFYCTLADAATQTTIEIVKVTAVSGTTFTIVRGQDGTTGTIFASGAVVSLRLVRASLQDFPLLDEANTFTFAPTFNTALAVGSGGTGLTSLTAGYIPFGNGTSAFSSSSNLFWDNTNNRLGIGTTAPPQRLTVWGSGTLPSAIANCQLLVGDTSGFANTGLALVTNAGNASAVTFGSTASPTLGRIEYDNTNNYMRFLTNSAEKVRIFSSGGVSIGNTTDPGATNLSVTGTIASASTITGTQYIVTTGILTATTQGSIAVGTLSYSDTGQLATYQASTNNYIQTEIQNTSAGASASSDHIVGNNNTTATTYYGDFGMNSSGWAGVAGTNSFSAPNMVYLTSTTGDLAIGTTTANIVRFSINGGADIAQITSTGLNSAPIGATTASTGAFTSLTATSVGTNGVLAKTGGKTAVTAVSATTTLTTGGTTLASQVMASGSTWRVVAYGTFVGATSATVRTFTMACFWGTTQLTAITTGSVFTTGQTTPWKVEFEITGSSATAAWITGFLSAQVTSATIPLNYAATAASVTGLTTTSTLDFRVANGTAAVDAINVHQVTIERIV